MNLGNDINITCRKASDMEAVQAYYDGNAFVLGELHYGAQKSKRKQENIDIIDNFFTNPTARSARR